MKNSHAGVSLTEGPIMKVLSGLAIPIMASSFLGTAYNITDMIWVGMLGKEAVAGIGAGGMFLWLANGLATLPRMGGQVNISQSLGREDKKGAERFAAASLRITLCLALLVSAICLLRTGEFLSFFKITDRQTREYAEVYTKITAGLVTFQFFNQVLTGIFTAQGDSKTPFAANLIGLAANMLLDPLLIFGYAGLPALGVAGAAVATAAAQGIVFFIFLHRGVFKGARENILKTCPLFSPIPGEDYGRVFKIGFPAAVQSSLYCLISMGLTRIVSAYGAIAIATLRVGGQIESLSWNTADGFAAALNAFTGQNFGAGKYERIEKGYYGSLKLLVLWGALMTFVFLVFPSQIASAFFHRAEDIPVAAAYLRIIGFSQIFMIVEIATIGVLSGLGRTGICSVISITLTGSRIPLAILLSLAALGPDGVWLSMSLTSIVKGILFFAVCTRLLGKMAHS